MTGTSNARHIPCPFPDERADISVFGIPDFDPNDYANAVLAGEQYPSQPGKVKPLKSLGRSPANEDISVAIGKLNVGLDDVEKQLKNVVTTHHEELLVQASGVTELEGSLTSVRGGLNELDGSLDKLRLKIHAPYQSLQKQVHRLERLQEASEILRRTSRFVILTRRLEVQLAEMDKAEAAEKEKDSAKKPSIKSATSSSPLSFDVEDEKERTIAKAALTIAELSALLDSNSEELAAESDSTTPSVPLTSINAVAAHLPHIDSARARITADMESMVINGLATLNQSLLASSLQTAHNLRVLPHLVNNLVSDLSDAVEGRIRYAFDLSRIAKEVLPKEPATQHQSSFYKSRVRTEPTNVTAPQWNAALWSSLESLIEEMADCCLKVYTLEKVLKVKKDPVTHVLFLDEAMKVLENKPSAIFWTALGRSLEKQARDAAKSSTFLQQTLSTNYPKLLRLFHSFFAKIAVQTDTVYSQAQQSPETILVLRALSNFESLYLSRSSNRLNEAVGQAFAGGARSPPGVTEGVNLARTVANELDSAKFDPLLVKNVAKYVVSSMDMFLSRIDGLVSKERAAVSLIGPTATPQQSLNGQIGTCLYHCRQRLVKLDEEYAADVIAVIKPNIERLERAFDKLVEPLTAAIRRELAAIIARIHRMDFGDSADPMAGMGGGPSPYMKDLVDKLNFIKSDVLSLWNVPEASQQWIINLVKHVIRTFVLHASIVKPLGETGKLQLTSDMTELEFALSAFMTDKGQTKRGGNWDEVGDDYRALRAMRPLLFLDNALLISPQHTSGLPPLIVLHHILVRSPISLPHALHGWGEAEYVRWVNEHTEQEAWSLVEGDLVHWEKINEAEGGETKGAEEYVRLARDVLGNAMNENALR
ncbi:Golgi transport complex subunit 5-domain-containing protein [Cristinia sonorae]|uniref:Conserved oligomeric Golgi complex subunit 5 n=1 Tax=Cristinia sonorae TaxID=1940300 RepID=A0A8K0UK37_9AGAR|nr:Golgi transport complex subunit 5-domain-containing protein [Cristinia sonorae]